MTIPEDALVRNRRRITPETMAEWLEEGRWRDPRSVPASALGACEVAFGLAEVETASAKNILDMETFEPVVRIWVVLRPHFLSDSQMRMFACIRTRRSLVWLADRLRESDVPILDRGLEYAQTCDETPPRKAMLGLARAELQARLKENGYVETLIQDEPMPDWYLALKMGCNVVTMACDESPQEAARDVSQWELYHRTIQGLEVADVQIETLKHVLGGRRFTVSS